MPKLPIPVSGTYLCLRPNYPLYLFRNASDATSSSLVLLILQPPSCLLAQILFPLIPSVPRWQRDLSTLQGPQSQTLACHLRPSMG